MLECSSNKEVALGGGVWPCSHAREMVLSGAMFARALDMAVSFSAPTARFDLGFPITSLGLAELLPIGFGCGELLSRFGRLLFSRKDV